MVIKDTQVINKKDARLLAKLIDRLEKKTRYMLQSQGKHATCFNLKGIQMSIVMRTEIPKSSNWDHCITRYLRLNLTLFPRKFPTILLGALYIFWTLLFFISVGCTVFVASQSLARRKKDSEDKADSSCNSVVVTFELNPPIFWPWQELKAV